MAADGLARRFGVAWLSLCLAFAAHVAEEAATGFLDVYNPTAGAIRAHLPWLLVPTLTFRVWLPLLVAVVLLLSGCSVFAFRGASWLRPLAHAFAGVMIVNSAVHAVGSIYMNRAMPGVYSSPFLFVGAIWLLAVTRRGPKAEAP